MSSKSKLSKTQQTALLVGAAAVIVTLASPAAATLDPDAEVVYLRKDCGTLANCETDLIGLQTWIYGTRQPDEQAPLLVDIGPGDFQGPFRCQDGNGWITLRGAGREQTRILSAPAGGPDALESAVDVVLPGGCTHLNFEDLALVGKRLGVYWQGDGVSTWTDVDIIGGTPFDQGPLINSSIGWWDGGNIGCTETEPPPSIPLHFFFNTRVIARGGNPTIGFIVHCGEHWFYGGEIVSTQEAPAPQAIYEATGVKVEPWGDFRAFGASIRANIGDSPGQAYDVPIRGVQVKKNGTFHMHGGIVNADASDAAFFNATSVVGLEVAADALVAHTPGTAFFVQSAAFGTATRLLGAAPAARSPFLWPPGDDPPANASLASPQVVSVQGADLYVERDCDASGDCDGSGTEPHLMVYSEHCTAGGSWFDIVTGRCRNDVAP